jgi:hypothetical protein
MIKKIALAFAALSLTLAPAAANAQVRDTRVRVENHSGIGQYITSIRIGNEHGRIYQILSAGYITPGYNRTIDFNDGEGHGHCVYAVQAKFANGTHATRTLNVCQASVWKIYDLDNTVE